LAQRANVKFSYLNFQTKLHGKFSLNYGYVFWVSFSDGHSVVSIVLVAVYKWFCHLMIIYYVKESPIVKSDIPLRTVVKHYRHLCVCYQLDVMNNM